MGWKRDALELLTRTRALFAPSCSHAPNPPRAIFVLRNNGIGDVLLVTPLLMALRQLYPKARIVAGVGSWAIDALADNPDVDEVLPVNAPWGNHIALSKSFSEVTAYLRTAEAARLADGRFDIGIDVLGSWQGSLLLMQAGIPWRLGVRGYAGGHSAAQSFIEYNSREHVAVAALRFASLLGAKELPEPRPRLGFQPDPHGAIVFAPGGGYAAKCWPLTNYVALAKKIAPRQIIVVGSEKERELGAALAEAGKHVEDRTGALSLRETLCVIGGSSSVVCNSSMAMHAAAAFKKPCLTLLGAEFPSAREHARQWGHPETRVLGREPEHDEIANPENVFNILTSENLLAR